MLRTVRQHSLVLSSALSKPFRNFSMMPTITKQWSTSITTRTDLETQTKKYSNSSSVLLQSTTDGKISASRKISGNKLWILDLDYHSKRSFSSSLFRADTSSSSKMLNKRRVIGAIDQGTTSTRFMLFDTTDLNEVASYQLNHENHFPKPGWVEQ